VNKNNKIKITLGYLDRIASSPALQLIMKKQPPFRVAYSLARIFDNLQKEIRIYSAEKQKLIEKYAERHIADGEEKKDDKVIRKWKKGDVVSDGQSVSLKDVTGFTEEMNKLSESEIDLGLCRAEIDLEEMKQCLDEFDPARPIAEKPIFSIEEMSILMPLIKIKE